VEADDEDAITHLAISGVGLALMRDEVARREAERGRIVIREDVEIRTALWFIYLAERAADSVLQSLVEVLASVWPPDMSRPRTRPS
jgi:DNA-binding transcriptional LysR family regulator